VLKLHINNIHTYIGKRDSFESGVFQVFNACCIRSLCTTLQWCYDFMSKSKMSKDKMSKNYWKCRIHLTPPDNHPQGLGAHLWCWVIAKLGKVHNELFYIFKATIWISTLCCSTLCCSTLCRLTFWNSTLCCSTFCCLTFCRSTFYRSKVWNSTSYRVARFFFIQHTKTGKSIPNDKLYIPSNICM
jgi:hypothetical protein